MTPGLTVLKAHTRPADTMAAFERAIVARGMKVFARIDFAADAEAAGLQLGPTLLTIFGNPKIGTELLQLNQLAGIDLPLKALAWSTPDGHWLSYNEPSFVAERHELHAKAVILKMSEALAGAADEAVNTVPPSLDESTMGVRK
ncbi:uncharacterized protein (DUF302 family) [Rhizobium pisi]|uniref:DUF302 domain-containing protein n=1 Tax=Rhizobium pisi TaxID=574561 RepID=A0A3R9AA11_9HYPH|nr:MULTISPECIES: DUF302 domain-containing protein [Rhizobium]MBB3138119.1 uncharacterized protein (DUF302 family) [Rhizobium pisi]RSB64757.1 DUF302 domain-containing protein [Rhizobium pisi]TAV45401.1 DUF302 domain-containing protein [Rhizobium leguminosarum]TAV45959.1 DUF302 domain-containing protein [Rhizobium leguminosarum]TAV63814.1 DUF302 domain-containing protein [Rhizobium leguminosarum]